MNSLGHCNIDCIRAVIEVHGGMQSGVHVLSEAANNVAYMALDLFPVSMSIQCMKWWGKVSTFYFHQSLKFYREI